MEESYRQGVPELGLSIERLTGRVPKDGWYYVLYRGEVKGRYRSRRQAVAKYKALLDASGWKPNVDQGPGEHGVPEAVERYMDQLEDYWSSSHKHARRGGKTMYRS